MRRWNLMAGTMRRTSSSLKSHAKGWPLWWVKYRSSKPVGQKRGWDIHSFTSSVNCALTLTAIGITCASLIQLHFFFLLTCTSLWLGFGIIWIWAIPVPLSIAHSGSKRFSTLVLSAGRAKKTFAWFKFRVLKLQPSIFSGQQHEPLKSNSRPATSFYVTRDGKSCASTDFMFLGYCLHL